MYLIRTFRLNLEQFNDDAFRILGVSRPVSFVDEENDGVPLVEQQFIKFMGMSPIEKRISTLFTNGLSTKEIGAMLDLSGKTIENRRKNILQGLGLIKPVDLVKLLVRFEERGFYI